MTKHRPLKKKKEFLTSPPPEGTEGRRIEKDGILVLISACVSSDLSRTPPLSELISAVTRKASDLLHTQP